jgi:hypothetical protein
MEVEGREMIQSVVTIVVSIGAINWFLVESRWAKSRVRDGYKVYSAPTGLKALYFTGIPLFIYGALVNSFENPGERWVSVILLAFAILGIAFFPK